MNAKKPIKRRDAQGRIDPQYARELLEKGRETKNDHDSPEAGRAFLKGASSNDELAEELGEAFVQAVTSGEESEGDRHERVTARGKWRAFRRDQRQRRICRGNG